MAKVTGKLIKEAVDLVKNADERNLEELGKYENRGIMGKIRGDFFDLDTMPKAEAAERAKAFADAKPVAAFERLLQLQKKHLLDFESMSDTAWIFSEFMLCLVYSAEPLVPECLLVAEQYVNSGGVGLTCELLAMPNYVAHREDELRQPNIAYNIGIHLTLLGKAFFSIRCKAALEKCYGRIIISVYCCLTPLAGFV